MGSLHCFSGVIFISPQRVNTITPDGVSTTRPRGQTQATFPEVADACFTQLKSEIQQKELSFGLFHEFIEDYSEIVLRELLINAIVHRDYSRQQVIEIRKYPTYLEIESPGMFPEGVDETNYLRKTNPRNPNIIDVFRSIKYAEKAGSGFDKIFADLLSKEKKCQYRPLQIQALFSV